MHALRVALVTPRYAPHVGGIEAHVEGLAVHHAAAGLEVAVLTQARRHAARVDPGGIAVEAFRELVPSEAYPVAPGVGLALRRRSFDVVHAHSYHGIVGLQAALASRAPLVFTPHYHGGGHTAFARMLHRGYGPAGRWALSRSAAIICVSAAEAALLARDQPAVEERIVVIPNGVDAAALARAEPFEAERPVVLVVGRLEPYKHVVDVQRAMGLVAADAELVVVGTGPDEAALREGAAGGIQTRLLGRVDDEVLRRWYRTAAVVVVASEHEAFGLTLLEGLVGGAAAVATELPAHAEVVGLAQGADRVRFVVPGAAPAALARAIDEALAGGRPGPLPAGALASWSDVAAQTRAVYEDVAGR